ncbi:hypothetical protein CCR85_09270 [Rhodothalassium salexigens]|nr:hypothetical protein [Rhodothalassium salexigens]
MPGAYRDRMDGHAPAQPAPRDRAVSGGHWLVRLTGTGTARQRLVCFHHAAGGPAFFWPVARAMGPTVEVLAVQLPGRERRIRARHLTDYRAALDGVTDALAAEPDKPTVLFGHSMGAALAYDTAARLGPALTTAAIAVSARATPGEKPVTDPATLSEPDLIAHLTKYGGVSDAVLADAALRRLFLPLFRSDLRLIASRPEITAATERPLLALAGRNDRHALPDAMEAGWAPLARGGFTLERVEGGHFFPAERPDTVARCLHRTLDALAPAAPRKPAPALSP